MATERIRFTISIDEKLYKEMEDFRFSERFNTMSKATEELLIRGLESWYAEEAAILDDMPDSDITVEEAFREEA